jgi:hypothetical protein
MSLHTSYHADSDADDEYERSVITSPHLHIDSESSPIDSDIQSAEHTPTKFGHPIDGPRSPRTLITEWGVEECKEFLTSLGLLQYHGAFRGERIREDVPFLTFTDDSLSRRKCDCWRSPGCFEA